MFQTTNQHTMGLVLMIEFSSHRAATRIRTIRLSLSSLPDSLHAVSNLESPGTLHWDIMGMYRI